MSDPAKKKRTVRPTRVGGLTRKQLASIKHAAQELSSGPAESLEEADWFDSASKRARVKRLGLKNTELADNISARKKYAFWTFWLLVGWLSFVAVAIMLVGLELPALQYWFQFNLSDTVLTTLIAGATVNVIGLFGVVVVYLFPRSKYIESEDVPAGDDWGPPTID